MKRMREPGAALPGGMPMMSDALLVSVVPQPLAILRIVGRNVSMKPLSDKDPNPEMVKDRR